MASRHRRLTHARRAVERRVVDAVLGVSAWVIERRLLTTTGKKRHDGPRRHVTMRL